MNYMRGFANLGKQWQLHYEPACQKVGGAGRYKGRWIPKFRFCMGLREFRSRLGYGRSGHFSAGSHPAILLSVFVLSVSF